MINYWREESSWIWKKNMIWIQFGVNLTQSLRSWQISAILLYFDWMMHQGVFFIVYCLQHGDTSNSCSAVMCWCVHFRHDPTNMHVYFTTMQLVLEHEEFLCDEHRPLNNPFYQPVPTHFTCTKNYVNSGTSCKPSQQTYSSVYLIGYALVEN